MLTKNFDALYSQMIAGSVAMHAGDVEQTVAYAAIEALGTKSIHYSIDMKKGESRAYYFAVPSRQLSSVEIPTTPLVAAIPWNPAHQGDGAYVHRGDGMSAVAIISKGDLRLLYNLTDILDRYIAEIDLPIFEVSDAVGARLHSALSRGRRAGDKLGSLVSRFSLAVIGLGLLTGFSMKVANGYLSAAVDDDYTARSRALTKAVEQINFNSPLTQQIARIHQVSTVALGSGGWLESFRHHNGSTRFDISVKPGSRDAAIRALGGSPQVEDRGSMLGIVQDTAGAPPAPDASLAAKKK